jgi:hypothetical protein
MMNKFGDIEPTVLDHVHEGMSVYDVNEHKIGTVSYVRLTDENPAAPGPETATASKTKEPFEDSFVENIAEAFVGSDDLPEEVRRKLLRDGYIRVDTGILKSDRFVTPDQISRVSDENVYLSVSDDDVIRS